MHDGIREYCKGAIALHAGISGKVLEVGAFDVNGTIRDQFTDKIRFPEYVGVDMREGPGVDFVMDANNLEFPDSSFDALLCCDMIEHDARFWESAREFHRVLRPGGFAIVTAASLTMPPHEYPYDYWRFTTDGIRALGESAGFEVLDTSWYMGNRFVMATWHKAK